MPPAVRLLTYKGSQDGWKEEATETTQAGDAGDLQERRLQQGWENGLSSWVYSEDRIVETSEDKAESRIC